MHFCCDDSGWVVGTCKFAVRPRFGTSKAVSTNQYSYAEDTLYIDWPKAEIIKEMPREVSRHTGSQLENIKTKSLIL